MTEVLKLIMATLAAWCKLLFQVGVTIPEQPPKSGPLPLLHYKIHQGNIIEVTEMFVAENHFGWEVTIPQGYLSDGASIPPLFWPFIGHPFSADLLQPSLVHDWLCERAAMLGDYEHRVLADGFFFWLLREAGVSYWRRTLVYLAVRFYGRWTYRPNTAELYRKVNENA